MEVYQSSRTAAEMEYALGAVPSIGANGNWFIGEQDTGTFAGGVDVTGAELGQTIVAAEVDENGRPTQWLAASFPAAVPFMGVRTNLIINIAISTDENGKYPSDIEITQRDDGTPLNLNAFILQTDISTGVSYGAIQFNNTPVAQSLWIPTGNDKYPSMFIRSKDGGVFTSAPGRHTGFLPVGVKNDNNVAHAALDVINKISIPGGYCNISKGTYIKIWEIVAE